MQIAFIGLGKMGANMARRLCRAKVSVIGFNRSDDITKQLANEEGLSPASSLDDAIAQLSTPRLIWLMLPAGDITESYIKELKDKLSDGDVVIDGGNANYMDSMRRGDYLKTQGIGYIDAGTSGGVWGLDNGYCLMVGGEKKHVQHLQPILKILAPSEKDGWAHVGPVGAGHFSKMIHNGIEYGMMQAYAEGFALLKNKSEFDFDLAQLTELWRHGSVVRSWLLDLSADFLKDDQELTDIAPFVADSGEGRWTIDESIRQGVATPVLAMALYMRFASQNDNAYSNKVLAMMRNAFGGHLIKDK